MNWQKTNYRGIKIPAAAGIIFTIALVLIWGLLLYYQLPGNYILPPLIYLTVIVSLAGFVDDLAGAPDYRGFRGHVAQLLKGKLTTGIFKITIVMAAVMLTVPYRGIVFYIQDLLLVLLMTNFVNLLDLRPGRALKFSLVYSLVLIFDFGRLFLPFYILLVPYLYLELKEKVMMGDSGSNTLGAIIGFVSIYSLPVIVRSLLTLSLLVLNLLSENYSFTDYIKNNRYLNYLDHIGRESNK